MTEIQRIKSDTETIDRREVADKATRDDRKRNDELTKERRYKVDKNIENNRLKNDEITSNRREIRDGNLSLVLGISLLVLTILVIGTFFVV